MSIIIITGAYSLHSLLLSNETFIYSLLHTHTHTHTCTHIHTHTHTHTHTCNTYMYMYTHTHTHTHTHSAIAKARENIISDAISDSSGSSKITTPTSGGPVQPPTHQHPTAEKKGQRSPAHAPQPPQQRTVTVTLKDVPITKVGDVIMA